MTSIDIAARALAGARSANSDYNTLTSAQQDVLKNVVRVVLNALRDPGEHITAAGAEIIRHVQQGESEVAFRSDAANTWRFMIDAMLADG